MRNLVGIVVCCALLAAGCGYASPGAGSEIVLVRKPYVFGHGGIDPTPVKTGAKFIALSTQELVVDMQPRTFIQHFDDMFTSDGVPLVFNVGTKLRVTDSVLMATKFGVWEYDSGAGISWPGWFGNNLQKPIENYIRQAVRKHGLNETAINPVATDAIDAEVKAAIEKEVARIGLPVSVDGFTVGRASPPDAVKNQRIETASQQQRKLTEDQRKLAEDARKDAELARAVADNAYRNAVGMTPSQFIQLEQVKMLGEACAKGHCNVVVGQVPVVLGNDR